MISGMSQEAKFIFLWLGAEPWKHINISEAEQSFEESCRCHKGHVLLWQLCPKAVPLHSAGSLERKKTLQIKMCCDRKWCSDAKHLPSHFHLLGRVLATWAQLDQEWAMMPKGLFPILRNAFRPNGCRDAESPRIHPSNVSR